MMIARGGLSWVVTVLILMIVAFLTSFLTSGYVRWVALFFSGVLFLLWCLLLIFFRDPERMIGSGVIAVADGKIREITQGRDPEVGDCTKISTFMNIHNVHVNRMPLEGTIEMVTHHPGRHLPAFQKESENNERVVLLIHTKIGPMKVIQIAGTIARRIVPYVTKGDHLNKGEKLGLIRLGSRVDIYLPTKKIKTLSIQVHDNVRAGVDTIAEIND